MHTNVTKLVSQHVEQALRQQVAKDAVWWDVSFQAMPSPDGRVENIYSILLSLPSPILGERLIGTALLPFSDATQIRVVTNTVVEMMDGLRAAKDQILSDNNSKSTVAGEVVQGEGGFAPDPFAALKAGQ